MKEDCDPCPMVYAKECNPITKNGQYVIHTFKKGKDEAVKKQVKNYQLKQLSIT